MLVALLALIAETTVQMTERRKVTVTVMRADPVTESEWKRSRQKSERIIVDEQGRRLLLRLIEHE